MLSYDFHTETSKPLPVTYSPEINISFCFMLMNVCEGHTFCSYALNRTIQTHVMPFLMVPVAKTKYVSTLFLLSTSVYLFIVGAVGYFCTWSLSRAHVHTVDRFPLDKGSARRTDLLLNYDTKYLSNEKPCFRITIWTI